MTTLVFAVAYVAGGAAGAASITSGLGLSMAAAGTLLATLGHALCAPGAGVPRRAGTAVVAGVLAGFITWPADPRLASLIYDWLPFPTVMLLLHFAAIAAISTAAVAEVFGALEQRRPSR